MSHVAHSMWVQEQYESCHIFKRVTSHLWMSHVTHIMWVQEQYEIKARWGGRMHCFQVRFLKCQLDTEFTVYTHCRADFWEIFLGDARVCGLGVSDDKANYVRVNVSVL